MTDIDTLSELSSEELTEQYPTLGQFSDPVKAAERKIVGRDHEIVQLLASMSRPELCNALLLAPAGAGKSALLQATMLQDTGRVYREVDVARMIAAVPNVEQFAGTLKNFFDEAEQYAREQHHELVLFMDEFHQIVQLSPAAVEALKPILAASGARGLRIIAATTYDEFKTHIAPNQPLVERLQRINLTPTDRKTTISILRGMATRYAVADQFYDDNLFELIYEYTERFVPASSQPRKSILVLDSMVGWHRYTGRAMDKDLLADVLLESINVNVAFRVDATKIKKQLDSKVLSQDYATSQVAQRLQLCVADLHDKNKPLSSFLFTGSTGTGKLITDCTLVPVFLADGSMSWKRHGDLVPGDFVFNRIGVPVEVLGVFPNKPMDIFRVTLWDGRTLDVGGPHLWSVYTAKMRSNKHAGKVISPRTMTTLEMLEKGVVRTYAGDTREHLKFFIPANGAVQWPEQAYEIDPYLVGVFLGNGCLTQNALTLSSDDAHTVLRAGELLGSTPKEASAHNYSWVFPTGEKWGKGEKVIQTKDVFASAPEMIGTYSADRRIPAAYLAGSVEQRWELIRGLFDTDGSIGGSNDRFNVSYSTFSKGLAEDLRQLLFSVGVSNTLKSWTRVREDGRTMVEYAIHVKVGNEDKVQFFSLPRKRALAEEAVAATAGRSRVKKFDMVGIKSIEKLPEQQSASCIYIADDEHLYQAGEFIVTHNTELTKQLSRLLFGDDQRRLIRFDMSEFAEDRSLPAFKSELTAKVWNMGHAVILFDEIEKASSMVTRLLLQVLDDARLSDDNGREVSFLNCYIVLTTNAGSEVYEQMARWEADDDGSGDHFGEYMKLIRTSIITTAGSNGFPPELLGRIDAIVPFQPLTLKTQQAIVRNKLRHIVQEVLTKHNTYVRVSDDVLQYLIADKGDSESNAGGARTAIAKMTTEVTTKIAAFINAHPTERSLAVEVVGEMVSNNKNRLKSDAYIEVTAQR